MQRDRNKKHLCCHRVSVLQRDFMQVTMYPSNVAARHSCEMCLKTPDGLQKTGLKKGLK